MSTAECARALIVACLCLCGVGAPATQAAPSARLSWDEAGEMPSIDAPMAEWRIEPEGKAMEPDSLRPERYRTLLHLSVWSSEQLDSLGFFLRWAAGDSAAGFELRGIHVGKKSLPMDGSARSARDSVGAIPVFHAQPLVACASDVLAALGQEKSGAWFYPLGLEVEFRHGDPLRIEATGLTARTRSGEAIQLGDPGATLGDGWRLELPPLVVDVYGRLNKRYIESVLSLRGFGLDRLATFFLTDARGRIVYATRVERVSDRRIDLMVSNVEVAEGRYDVEYWSAGGSRARLTDVVQAAYFAAALPGDSNRGTKPGAEP